MRRDGRDRRSGETRKSMGHRSHLPSASLGHYASLSFVVIGTGHGVMPLEVGSVIQLAHR